MNEKVEVPEEFIAAHIAICTAKRKHVKGKGNKKRSRQCAQKLYRDCVALGIEPTINRADFIKAYDEKKAADVE